MDLIDRYLSAIGALVPQAARTDIVAELRDVLMTRREEAEAAAGRPLTRREDEELLRAFGNPLAVAARYGRQQHLVGPELYPLYGFVLRIVLAVVVASGVVTGIVSGAAAPGELGRAIGVAFNIVWTGGFAAIGAVTLTFAILQRTPAGAKLLDQWNPRDLPRTPRRRTPKWFGYAAGIAAQVVFVLWWTHLVTFPQPFVPLQPGQTISFALAPIWRELFWPVLVLAGLGIATHAMKLAAPSRPRLGYGVDLAQQAAMVALGAYALHAGRWVVVTGAGLPPGGLQGVQTGVDIGFLSTLIILVVVGAATLVYDAWRLYRGAPGVIRGR